MVKSPLSLISAYSIKPQVANQQKKIINRAKLLTLGSTLESGISPAPPWANIIASIFWNIFEINFDTQIPPTGKTQNKSINCTSRSSLCNDFPLSCSLVWEQENLIKDDSDRLLNPQHWISTLMFELQNQFEHSQLKLKLFIFTLIIWH